MDKSKGNRVHFKNQPIYMGLDVHKKSWSVSIFSKYGEYKTFSQSPEVDPLVHYLSHQFPGALYFAVYEAGYCGFWIHDRLKEKGIECIVANPADIPTKDKERRTKRDRLPQIGPESSQWRDRADLCSFQIQAGGPDPDPDASEHG